MEPLVASTDEYLVKKIQEDRARLMRDIQELGRIARLLEESYDPDVDLDAQDLFDRFGDLMEVGTEITMLTVRISGMEAIPRVG